MDEELNRIRRRMRDLEPLAFMWDTYKADLFKVCSELHREHLAMYEAILNGTPNTTDFQSSLAEILKGVRECR